MQTTLEVVQAAVNAHQNGVKTLDQAIKEAINEARTTCDRNGDNSPNCAVAWEIVEELQAEKAHQQQAKKRKTDLESYCEQHPEAVECLIYDV
ncbi:MULTISPECIES: Calvin cycle protein CP12 [Calothrix]|uniref:Calvin cycle protein CP12 n=2 Tax=Calothrix TaxID=1186 RepID=A0ABR8ADD5_9CYAN|nr:MULTISPECIES: Calvin cycle protein CP12 [Calothrix]MBD2197924.1 Calvin cycle protein CP12 [Calothrix parietina FACHB-288]MBD2226791.1 Calvin cycle protein CP12 [Calothrix anomala FACHB-343]